MGDAMRGVLRRDRTAASNNFVKGRSTIVLNNGLRVPASARVVMDKGLISLVMGWLRGDGNNKTFSLLSMVAQDPAVYQLISYRILYALRISINSDISLGIEVS